MRVSLFYFSVPLVLITSLSGMNIEEKRRCMSDADITQLNRNQPLVRSLSGPVGHEGALEAQLLMLNQAYNRIQMHLGQAKLTIDALIQENERLSQENNQLKTYSMACIPK